MSTRPKITLRYGAHAEKEYLERLAAYLDGLLYSGNLIEATQAASVSLLLKIRKGTPAPSLYINPMTYIFGPYVDPDTGRRRSDLKWIKSFRKKSGKIEIKDAYQSLGHELGAPFASAVDNQRAVDPISDPHIDRDAVVEGTLHYQKSRLSQIFTADEEIQQLAGDGAEQLMPSVVFAPYFYSADEWLIPGIDTNADLAKRAVNSKPGIPVHMIACVSRNILDQKEALGRLAKSCSESGADAVWLWLSKFDELSASVVHLKRYRALVAELSQSMAVHSYAGGFWSMLLCADGMSGISHGVGYGERKPVIQVIGAAAPTVRYYLPTIAKRVGVPDIERTFSDLGIDSAEDFFREVCGCQICRGVIGSELRNFSKFGEMHRSAPEKRPTQTAAAAKLCRFHFLVHRILYETKGIEKCASGERAEYLRQLANQWPTQPTISSEAEHVARWIDSLEGDPMSIEESFA